MLSFTGVKQRLSGRYREAAVIFPHLFFLFVIIIFLFHAQDGFTEEAEMKRSHRLCASTLSQHAALCSFHLRNVSQLLQIGPDVIVP